MIVFGVNTIWGKIKQYFAICQIFKYKSGMGTKNEFRIIGTRFRYCAFLELCTLRRTWERNHVANVLHTCYEQDKTLETKSETCVRT